jgi:L-fuconolactonase
MFIDAHHHLWVFDPAEFDWIDDSMTVLKQDFKRKEFEQILSQNDFSGSVVVQARQSMQETLWLANLANQSELIKGVVGWVDLKSESLNEQLAKLSSYKKLVGFRHVIQGEADSDFLDNADFIRGLKILSDKGYCYDLLVFANQLPSVIKMLQHVPKLNVVIDHIAKPDIKSGREFELWRKNMNTLAQNPNCYCKLSGMVTEADWQNWTSQDIRPYMQTVLALFGTKRTMFGSDWPVCLLAGEYDSIKQLVLEFIELNYPQAKEDIFAKNASRFYRI